LSSCAPVAGAAAGRLLAVVALLALVPTSPAHAITSPPSPLPEAAGAGGNFHFAPDGDDANAGLTPKCPASNPCRTLRKPFEIGGPDTIAYFHGGTYAPEPQSVVSGGALPQHRRRFWPSVTERRSSPRL
jgi:hypothetical protein